MREARAEANPVFAAKRLQDLGQAYGAEDNLSVIVLRLSNTSALRRHSNHHHPPPPPPHPPHHHPQHQSNSHHPQVNNEPLGRLMRELRNAVRLKGGNGRTDGPGAEACTCPCCLPKITGHDAPTVCCCHASPGSAVYLNGVLRNVVNAR